jgi:hypothetical protein
MSKNKWGYERVILNKKARDILTGVIGEIKQKADLADVVIDDVAIATTFDEKGNMWFELGFYHNNEKHTMISSDVDDFDNKFIDFLFSVK